MRKRGHIFITLLCTVLIFIALPVTAHADMGPKPSVRIQFENMGDELCYGTLLSESSSTGPASAWDGKEENARIYSEENPDFNCFTLPIWEAFVNYEDPDGYYFLQEGWKVSDVKYLSWTYYPPSKFKILLYYPETNTFVSSGICEQYAFDTYYTVDMDHLSQQQHINAYRSYKYGDELLSLAARIVLTIVIEMLVALLFGFRKKKQLLILAVTNTATQVALNVALNVIDYKGGPMAFSVFYVLLEIVVIVIEAVLYCKILKKASETEKQNWYYTLYSLVANSVSFGAGLLIAKILPGIF